MKDNYFFPFSNYKEMKDAYDEGKFGWIELTIDNNYYYCSMGEGKIDNEI